MQEENHSLLCLLQIQMMVLTGHFFHQNHLIGSQRNSGLQMTLENFSSKSKSYCRYLLFAHGKECIRQRHIVIAVPYSKRCWGFQSPSTSPACPDKIGRVLVNERIERLLRRPSSPDSLCPCTATPRQMRRCSQTRPVSPSSMICCLAAGNHITGRGPCSAVRLSICERNNALPSLQQFATTTSQPALNASRRCVTSEPKNSGTSSVGSQTTTGTPFAFMRFMMP